MSPNIEGLKVVYLHPGEVCFSAKPIVVSTVLGSCLSIVMYCKTLPYAGISHCQLPLCKGDGADCVNCADPYKYVDCTVRSMVKKFGERNIIRSDIEVKIFGGGDVLKNSPSGNKLNTVGKQNIMSANKAITENNLNLSVSDVGGQQGRKILFFTKTGEVFLNRLKNNGQS
ncbi:MAG: chemotaxis protein CheD [Bacteroidetes bacterium]|nr:chemotaxis protein CheD [Bacteroidota bacterium]